MSVATKSDVVARTKKRAIGTHLTMQMAVHLNEKSPINSVAVVVADATIFSMLPTRCDEVCDVW